MVLKQSSADIESWSVGKLAALYINSFIASRVDSSENSQLEHVAVVLFKKEFNERAIVLSHLKSGLSSFIAGEDYERASLYRDMILHYNMHVHG